jgi:hypothetical protein
LDLNQHSSDYESPAFPLSYAPDYFGLNTAQLIEFARFARQLAKALSLERNKCCTLLAEVAQRIDEGDFQVFSCNSCGSSGE